VEFDEHLLRAQLHQLTGDRDLVALADGLEKMGVDSLLIARVGGRIENVVSGSQLRMLGSEPLLALIPDQLRLVGAAESAFSPEGERVGAQASGVHDVKVAPLRLVG